MSVLQSITLPQEGVRSVAGGFHRLFRFFIITSDVRAPRLGADRLIGLPYHVKLAIALNLANHDGFMQVMVGRIHGQGKA